MNDIIILEAREADATTKTANGDWQTVLNQPVTLEEGDQVLLKTAVIDTTKVTAGAITLEEDVLVEIDAIPYVVNYHSEDKTYLSGFTAPSAKQLDFCRYFAC